MRKRRIDLSRSCVNQVLRRMMVCTFFLSPSPGHQGQCEEEEGTSKHTARSSCVPITGLRPFSYIDIVIEMEIEI